MQANSDIRQTAQNVVYKPKQRAKTSGGIISTFINGILAGIMVSVGGCAYLSTDNKYLGSFLFSIGLFTIFSYGFALYTGRIGYAIGQNKDKNILLIPAWCGNLTGAIITGVLLHFTRISSKINPRAKELCSVKLSDSAFSILFLSFFCGLLMFIAADNFKNAGNPVQKYLAVIMPVMVFILCGFEHCVANMFYFTAGNSWNLKALLYMAVMTLGNSAGSFVIPLLRRAAASQTKL